jgi:hypothetical protein
MCVALNHGIHVCHHTKPSAYPPDMPLEGHHGDPSTLPKSVDKSEALFSMYLDRSDEDDRKTTERWKGECDAILIFVSHSYLAFEYNFVLTPCIDWSVLGRSCSSSCHFRSRPSAEFSGHFSVLSQKHLSCTRQFHYLPAHHPSRPI